MNSETEEYIKNWLLKANEDIAVIKQLSLDHPEQYTGAICFHAQQAVEKFLKAYLIYNNKEFKRVHDLDYLLNLCIELDEEFNDFELMNLTEFGVNVRYPDDLLIPSVAETMLYKDLAIQVKIRVEREINF